MNTGTSTPLDQKPVQRSSLKPSNAIRDTTRSQRCRVFKMDQPGCSDPYSGLDTALEKTIRYRQMVGLLTSSSIRSFRKQDSTTAAELPEQNDAHVKEKDVTASEVEKDEIIPPNVSIKEKKLEKEAATIIPSSSKVQVTGEVSTSTKYRRRPRNQHAPIAIDVIQYLFHNQANNSGTVDGDTSTLANMKQQDRQKQQSNGPNFTVQQHHPGYIPVKLWQNQTEYEQIQHQLDTLSSTCMANANASGTNEFQFMPVCFDCGGVIQPGVMNTTIRMVESNCSSSSNNDSSTKRDDTTPSLATETGPGSETVSISRTKRRRESRFKAKLYRKQHHGSKRQQQNGAIANLTTNRPNQPSPLQQQPHSKSNIWKYIWQQQNKYYHNQPKAKTETNLKHIYPFLNCCTTTGSHYYIVICGSCGAQIYLPDFQRESHYLKTLHVERNSKKKNQGQQKNNNSKNNTAWQSQQFKIKGMNHDRSRPLPIPSHSENISKQMKEQDIDRQKVAAENIQSDRQQNVETTPTILSSSMSIGVKRKTGENQHLLEKSESLDATRNLQPTTTLLNPQRKKKKTENTNGKNDLMAFLSSLNDR